MSNVAILERLSSIENIMNRISKLIAATTTTASVIRKENGAAITAPERYKQIVLESIINDSKGIQNFMSACLNAEITPAEVLEALKLQVDSGSSDGSMNDEMFREKFEKLEEWTKGLRSERIKEVAVNYEDGKNIAKLDSECASFNLTRQDLIEYFERERNGIVRKRDSSNNYEKFSRLKECVSKGIDFSLQ